MFGYRAGQRPISTPRRWAALTAAATLAVGLTVGLAAPADAASRAGTSLNLKTIQHVATKTNAGTAVVISGDKADLRGTTSRNLIGKQLSVQIKDGSSWSSYSGSGTVSDSGTFSIRITIRTTAGGQTFRVVYAGSGTLKGSSSSRSTTVWSWLPLVQLPVSSTDGSSDEDAAAHAQTDLTVVGKQYGSLLAGNVPAGGTGAATFDLGKHCRTFRTTIGLTDSSPSASSIAYSVYFGDVAEIAPTVKHGSTKTIELAMSKVSKLVLRNTEPDPANAFTVPTVAAWPGARVLCNAVL